MLWGDYRLARLMNEMDRLRQSFDRGANGYASPPAYPAMNIWSGPDKVVVTAELPGLKTENLEIAVQGRTLTLHGNPKPEEDDKREYHRRERVRGEFWRSIELPYEVEQDKVEARLDKGILAIALPRAECTRPRKIAVKSA